jgi:hypothetical protein
MFGLSVKIEKSKPPVFGTLGKNFKVVDRIVVR